MEIRLKQKDIEEAIAMFLASQGVARPVSNISFTMGRKDSGLSAEVECAEGTPGFVASCADDAVVEPKTVNTDEVKATEADETEQSDAEEAASEPLPNSQTDSVEKSDMSLFSR